MSRSRSRRGAHEEEEHENSERWLLTYADMITLLLALFIVLFSISVVNKSKLEALQKSLGVHPATGTPAVAAAAAEVPVPTPKPPTVNPALEQLKEQLQKALTAAGLATAAAMTIDANGLSVQLTDGVLFDSGQAVLLPSGIKVLAVIGPIIAQKANPVIVQGHTDNRIIATALYPTNWELSTARATSVLRYLLNTDRIAPTRLSATGYADTRPLVPNDTDAHRARNRRVTVLITAVPAVVTAKPETATAAKTAATKSPTKGASAPKSSPVSTKKR